MQRSASGRQSDRTGFGAVVPERLSGWRDELRQKSRPKPRPRPRPHADQSWRSIGDSEAEAVARHAVERRAARASERSGLLGRLRVSAPRAPRAASAWRELSPPLRTGAVLALVAVLGALALFELPWLKVQRVEVEGSSVVARSQLLADAGVRMGASTITLDTRAMTRALLAQPWVAGAAVSIHWPDTVIIAVQPDSPALLYRLGTQRELLSSTGALLGPVPTVAAQSAPPTFEDLRPLSLPARGETVLPPQLAGALVKLAAVFPAAYGVSVSRFVMSRIGALEIVSTAGWTADLGPALTSQQISALGPKLEALRALSQKLSLKTSGIKDIYLEDPSQIGIAY